MVCENCGYDVFIPGTKFRTISKIVTGTPQDVVIPIEVYLCGRCGMTVHKVFTKRITRFRQVMDYKKYIENVSDFPIKGIQYKDIQPLMAKILYHV